MPGLSQPEFERLLADPTKRIMGDIAWTDDLDHFPAQEMRASIESDQAWPIWAYGWWQPRYEKISYALIHRPGGRVFGLDIGGGRHGNPGGASIHGTHLHRWTAAHHDGIAVLRPDITLPWTQPVELWELFCAEANIAHLGRLAMPMLNEEAI